MKPTSGTHWFIMVAGRIELLKYKKGTCLNDLSGFTLIEILFAIFIFSIVISIVYGSYQTTFHTIHGAEKKLEDVNRARIIIERFSDDLQALVPGEDGSFQGRTNMFSSQRGDSVLLVTTACLKLNRSGSQPGRCLVGYEPELNEENGLLDFYRTEKGVLPGGDEEANSGRSNLIGTGLQEIRIGYIAEDGSESDEWNSTGEEEPGSKDAEVPLLPRLITLDLFYGSNAEADLEVASHYSISIHFKSTDTAGN
jgi:prepilin-type N-terminal cleavage/methylation domain-containing protein